MTPKENARELFDKMLGQCAADNGDQAFILAKNCAMIAVNNELEWLAGEYNADVYSNEIDEFIRKRIAYLKEVKTEIENF